MKGKLIVALLVLVVGAGSYFYLIKDKTQKGNTTVASIENNNDKDQSKTNGTSDTKKQDTTNADNSNSEKEKQVKLISGDIEKIKAALKENNITSNVAGDFSKDSKVTLNASSNKLSNISYIGENKSGSLSRNFTISIKHPVSQEFDINNYEPAKALIEKVTDGPLNDFEFSDGLSSKMSSMKDSKMSYDFIIGDNYKMSVDINKNSAETVTIKIELK